MGHGLTEWYNMIGILDPCKKENGSCMLVPSLVHVTRLSMYCRHPRLPIDLILSIPEGRESYAKYVSDLRLSEAYNIATNEADRARERNKLKYDLRARGNILDN